MRGRLRAESCRPSTRATAPGSCEGPSISEAPLTLWGLRMGALLACDLAVRLSRLVQLVLWQPVLNGEQHLDLMRTATNRCGGLGGQTEEEQTDGGWTVTDSG